jgi:hypothetical protein
MRYYSSSAVQSDAVKYDGVSTSWISTRGGASRQTATPRDTKQFRTDRAGKKWLAANSTPYTATLVNDRSALADAAIGALEKLVFTAAAPGPAHGDAPRFLAALTKANAAWGMLDDFAPASSGSPSNAFKPFEPGVSSNPVPERSSPHKTPGIDKTPSVVTPTSPETSDPLTASPDTTISSAANETAKAALVAWGSSWRSQSTLTPCGSCTGRACTVCSIRTGGSSSSGKPTGYAPRVLDYFDPASTTQDVAGKSATTTTTSTTSFVARTAEVSALVAGSTNAIVLENMKQGSPESEWLIGTADSSIEGFAVQFTINHGQKIDFKINTDSKNYRIDIYRIGYYNGDGARKVGTINKSLTTAQSQPIPLFDPSRNLVDAGNWSVSASWDIPADAVSGVYFAKLTRLDGSGGENMIPFIVRDDENKSDITFQTSDTTWQAYNWWGGYNFYGGVDASGHAGRAYAVSYNRPIITRDGGFAAGPQDFIFGAEYPAIRWLEQNGYDVNYISGIDTARSGEQLLNSKIFLSVGHDEYWSADQRANVEAARDAGVNLSFWSGNEVYWETRWENSIDASGTAYKTLVSYKERWSNDNIDVNGETSTWRDPQFGSGQPENGLTGTIFTVDSYRLDSITIPYDLSNFRFWSNTDVANIQAGQVYSLTRNLLGYEWDSDLDNGFRPAGLVPLSATTVDVNTMLLDYGNAVGAGTASHALTMYRAPSGALVFGAGTVYWSWGLDDHHDNEPTPTDANVQQAMVNLFADMGVQPATLVASLAAASQTTDHIAPTSTVVVPTSSQTYTAAQVIVISGTASDAGGGSVAVVEVSTDGGVTWHRATGFQNWSYSWIPLAAGTYNIKSRAVDDSVNLETPGAGTTITVSSAGTTSLFSPSAVPATQSDVDDGFVNLGMKFSSSQSGTIVGIRFYKGIGDGGVHVGSLWSSTGQLLASATFIGETASGWQTVTFSNPISIAAGTSYVASYNSQGHYASTDNYFDVARSNGPLTAQAGNGYYNYTTGTAFPSTASNGTNYWVDVVFTPVNTVNVAPVGTNDNGFLVAKDTPMTFAAAALLANDTDPNGDILSITGVGAPSGGLVSFNAQTNTITFTPTAGYTGTASFGYAISDGRGGISSAIVNVNVAAVAQGTSLFTGQETPSSLSDPDATQLNLGVKFVASTSGVITGIKYYKGAGDTGTHTGSLWSSTGTLLASATFINETASGWQTLTFTSPVTITAGTTYVASYHSYGHYTSTSGYFTTAHVNGQLTAPTNAGVYAYGNGNLFPNSTYGASNYWVDVLFNASTGNNHAPVGVNDSGFTTTRNSALAIAATTLLANDTDSDGNALTITGVSGGVNGTASFNAQTNTVTFTPTTGYTGAASFTYAISDGLGGTASANVSLTVNPPANQAPVAGNDTGLLTQQGTAILIAAATLLANDADANGDVLTVTGVSAPVNGTVSFNAQTNVITFTPTAGYTGAASFTYTISDGNGGTANGNVALSVNRAPVGVNDTGVNTTQNTAIQIAAATLLANDTDANGDALSITGVSAPVNGTVSFNAQTNIITFTPTAGYTGSASFTYALSDGRGGTASASVALTVNPPANQAPVAVSDTSLLTQQGAAIQIAAATLLANDTDANGDVLSITGVSAPVNGTVNFNAQTNIITFTPTAGYTGAASFTYAISDGRGGTASGNVALTVNRAPVGANDTGVTTLRDTAIQLTAASLLANDTDANGDALSITGVSGAVNGTVSFNAQTNIVTFTPTAGYTGAASFTYALSDGKGGTASANVALTVTTPPANVSLFTGSEVPATLSDSDSSQVNLGMKFVASSAGIITGIKYYKGAGDTGTHTATLWSSTGTLLATATFINETASGWQTVSFTNPVAITAGTTYVASYHSNGHYAATGNYFTTTVTNGSLSAPANAGVYTYGNGNLFPTSTYGSSNYWVDVLYSVTTGTNHAPVAVADTGYVTMQNAPLSIGAAALLANDTDSDSNTLSVTGVSGGVNGTASFNAQTNTVTFTPTAGYTGAASFTYTISDGLGGTANANVSLTVNAAPNQAPIANTDSGSSTLHNTAIQFTAAALLANDTDANGDALSITGVSAPVNGTVSFNAQTNIVTFTPTTGYTGAASFTYAISDGRGGTANANVGLTVTAPAVGVSLFAANATPTTVTVNDPSPVELGMKFTASQNGTVTGIKFYKGPQNTGTHTGSIWSSTGTLLGTLTFSNETASGWQTASLTTPVAITAGTSYVVSYHSNGNYSATSNYFTSATTNGPLTAPSSAASGGNGVYAYGSSSAFPSSSYNSTNYWVDVVFNGQLAS